MTKEIICPKCGTIIDSTKDTFTTLRVSRKFIDRVKQEQIDATLEDTIRRLLGWPPEEEE